MVPWIVAATSAAVWCIAVRRYRRRYGRSAGFARGAAFAAGTVVAATAAGPPLDVLADASFAWHMVQHMVLLLVAPPLVLLAQPLELALAVLPPRVARRLVSALRVPPLAWFAHPVVAFALFFAVTWLAHFTGLYEAAAENEAVHVAEHALFLAAAFAFWAPVTGATPFPHALAFPVRIFYLFAAMPPSAFLGFVLFGLRASPYPHYANVADVHAGGEIMWIAGGAAMFAAMMLVAAAWARSDQRFAAESRGG
ncbi:MAG: cytochrome c oxidase assembly protein [Candidatus Velthaea sp.]